MTGLPVPIRTFEAMLKHCLSDVRQPKGSRQRRRARRLHGARDAALLALAYTYGAKTSELLNLRWEHCHMPQFHTGNISFSNRPERSKNLPLIGPTQQIFRLWKGLGSGNIVFHRISKRAREGIRELTPSAIRAAMKKRHDEVEAHIQAPNPPTPQRLRSSFRKLLNEEGTRNAIIRDIMGLRSRRVAPRDDEKEDARVKEALRSVKERIDLSVRIPSAGDP